MARPPAAGAVDSDVGSAGSASSSGGALAVVTDEHAATKLSGLSGSLRVTAAAPAPPHAQLGVLDRIVCLALPLLCAYWLLAHLMAWLLTLTVLPSVSGGVAMHAPLHDSAPPM